MKIKTEEKEKRAKVISAKSLEIMNKRYSIVIMQKLALSQLRGSE
jgi:hypothetical protein